MTPNSSASGSPRARGWLRLLGSLALAFGTSLTALGQPTVATLSGGPNAGYANGSTFSTALFNTPVGLALDSSGNLLFVADRDNNALRELNLPGDQTFTFTTNHLSKPVAVVLDSSNNVYVLNRGNGANGSVVEFDLFGNFMGTLASGLSGANGMAINGAGTLFITLGNSVAVVSGGFASVLATPSSSSTLKGVTVMDNGYLAVCDASLNGIWIIHPVTGATTALTGFNGAGDTFGASNLAQFNQPYGISGAGGGALVVADFGNNRVKVVNQQGTVTNLYGVASNYWVTCPTKTCNPPVYPGWWDGPTCGFAPGYNCEGKAESRSPAGVLVARDGSVYSTEDYYHLIRRTTATGLTAPSGVGQLPLFSQPAGVALDAAGANLYIADYGNAAVRILNLANNQTSTFLTGANGLTSPAAIYVDPAGLVYVLDQGSGANGALLKFDRFGNLLSTLASNLPLPSAMANSGIATFFVALQNGGILQLAAGQSNLVATVNTNASVRLSGIGIFDDGTLAVSDSGNHVVWQVNPVSHAVTLLTGSPGNPGSTLGSAAFAKLNQPLQLSRANGNLLVAADYGNNRLVVIDRSGAITNVLNSTNALVWFGASGDPYGPTSSRFVPTVEPVGVAVGTSGAVFSTEGFYDDVRELLGTGLTLPGQATTNFIVSVPSLSPGSGYYPMGQLITVSSANPNVYYTSDGSDPTTNSFAVVMTNFVSGNYVGTISWFGSTNDLTSLKLKAFVGTNTSSTVSGQAASANTIGIPGGATPNGIIPAGVGSTVVVPIVVNLQPGTQIRSYQFRVEIAPNSPATNMIGAAFQTLPISANDFIPLTTSAQGNSTLNLPGQAYSFLNTRGLLLSTAGAGSFSFQRYAVVALLEIPIPATAAVGDTYSISVNNASATSDGVNANVPLTPLGAATLQVTNLAYVVGDSSAPNGLWYNAGTFGNGDLDNSDVNNAFSAALGLRVPYVFSDLFNALDVYPPDSTGLVGGDGALRFLDWQTVLRRSLRLDGTNYGRVWSTNGILQTLITGLPTRNELTPTRNTLSTPWYRQALVGATSIGNIPGGYQVNVPVYVKLVNGASLSGLQFRAVITPRNNAPAFTQAPAFTPAAGVPAPVFVRTVQSGQAAVGWPLGSFNFTSGSSNFLGWITFSMPLQVEVGDVYAVSFAQPDGAPDIDTEYELESRTAYVAAFAPAPQPSICSDEWKLHFFSSLNDPAAADLADADADGEANWAEYLAGTDPTDGNSKLKFLSATKQAKPSQIVVKWQTAPGRTYELQSAPNFRSGPWTPLSSVSGDGSIATVNDNISAGATRYYRLRLVP